MPAFEGSAMIALFLSSLFAFQEAPPDVPVGISQPVGTLQILEVLGRGPRHQVRNEEGVVIRRFYYMERAYYSLRYDYLVLYEACNAGEFTCWRSGAPPGWVFPVAGQGLGPYWSVDEYQYSIVALENREFEGDSDTLYQIELSKDGRVVRSMEFSPVRGLSSYTAHFSNGTDEIYVIENDGLFLPEPSYE
jgi:hypothetical protein